MIYLGTKFNKCSTERPRLRLEDNVLEEFTDLKRKNPDGSVVEAFVYLLVMCVLYFNACIYME